MTSVQLPISTKATAADLPGVRDGWVRGIYVHVPFCFHKCHYCDFYSIVDSRERQDQFVDRLIEEILAARPFLDELIETIFIGGGTPTLLTTAQWDRVLAAIANYLVPAQECEFTVEANPETVTPELAHRLAGGGVNRVSVGAQSFHPHLLAALERQHDPQNVARSMRCFREAGIANVNLDLIFAIPGQTLDEWKRDLEQALVLEPEHLSCYGLMYEPNTPLTQRVKAGEVVRADEDLEAAMYEHAIDALADAGFEHYEISNWARQGRRCRHNALYWTNAEWWPLGPSASGHVAGVRWKNMPRISDYLDSDGLPPVQDVERLDVDDRLGEELMLALRLRDGIEASSLDRWTPATERGAERRAAIDRHVDGGLLERADDRIRLSRAGLLLADRVLADLL